MAKTPHIVFIHGLNCSGKIFTHLQHKLPKHRSTMIDYNSGLSVEDSLQTALEELPDEPFSIVSHSLGGIIGHLIAGRTDVPLEKLVTISTPFGGSDVAGKLKWFYPSWKVFRDLAPGSSILKECKKASLVHPFLSIVSISGNLPLISGENDGVVSVASQRAIAATKRVDIAANHFEVVQDAHTISEVKKFIFD